MELKFNEEIAENYHSAAQKARVLTENWMNQNMYCPRCGFMRIKHFENNRPVADFYCPSCGNEYELKSKNGVLGHKITDGTYSTMIERITSNNNPDFFFMSYSKEMMKVNNLIIVPKNFFVPNIIEKRKPLSFDAHRAGWIGCNILINKIPEQGRIAIVANGRINDIKNVVDKVNKSHQLEIKDIQNRGWLMDVLNCVNKTPSSVFSLNEIYKYERDLYIKHPQNQNVKAKIRQQIQLLRDKGFIKFLGNGRYIKLT